MASEFPVEQKPAVGRRCQRLEAKVKRNENVVDFKACTAITTSPSKETITSSITYITGANVLRRKACMAASRLYRGWACTNVPRCNCRRVHSSGSSNWCGISNGGCSNRGDGAASRHFRAFILCDNPPLGAQTINLTNNIGA
jgi:hypothetical protein